MKHARHISHAVGRVDSGPPGLKERKRQPATIRQGSSSWTKTGNSTPKDRQSGQNTSNSKDPFACLCPPFVQKCHKLLILPSIQLIEDQRNQRKKEYAAKRAVEDDF